MEHLQHYQEIAHLAREQLVESHEQFLAGEWNLFALKSVRCLLVPTQPLLTVCSHSPVIYSVVFMCTTLDLCDFLCSICTVVGELTLFPCLQPIHLPTLDPMFQQLGFVHHLHKTPYCWYVCYNVPFAALLPVLCDFIPCRVALPS